MPLKTKQHGQFIVLMTGDIGINYSSLKHQGQNIIVTNKYDDILTLIESTQFDLILLDLTANYMVASVPHFCPPWTEDMQETTGSSLGRHPWQPELIALIKDPLCINNKTPLIAVANPTEGSQSLMEFDDSLIRPITEEQLNEVIDFWQTKTLALAYIQMILDKTKNNRSLTLTIFEKLFAELPLQIIDIKNALENKQYELAKEVTHKLNGSVSFCGLMDIQVSANTLENYLLTNNYASTHQHFLILQQHTLNFTRHKESILANLGAAIQH
jgi:HPt (histidine-containing phosphotransfer) domain-containing protein